MLVYLVLQLCLIKNPFACEIQTLPVGSFECALHAQSIAADWMAENDRPTTLWRLDKWRCQSMPPAPEKDANRYRPQAG